MLHPCELQALIVGNRVTDWKQVEEVGTCTCTLYVAQASYTVLIHLVVWPTL